MLRLTQWQFSWHRCQQAQISRGELLKAVEPIRAAFKAQFKADTTLGDGAVLAFSQGLLELEEHLYHFVKYRDRTNQQFGQASFAVRFHLAALREMFWQPERLGRTLCRARAVGTGHGSKARPKFSELYSACLEGHWFKTTAPTLLLLRERIRKFYQ